MKKPKLIISILSALCSILLITFLVNLYNYNLLLNPVNTHKHKSECFAERRAYFILDGVEYRWADESDIPETVTPDKFVGYLSDFEGAYSVCPETARHSGLYTIKEDDDILITGTMYFSPYEE